MTHTDILHGDHFFRINPNQQARDYLSCIPESAAGGDDDAVRIARQCDAALARFIDVPGSASQSYHWPQVGRHPGSAE